MRSARPRTLLRSELHRRWIAAEVSILDLFLLQAIRIQVPSCAAPEYARRPLLCPERAMAGRRTISAQQIRASLPQAWRGRSAPVRQHGRALGSALTRCWKYDGQSSRLLADMRISTWPLLHCQKVSVDKTVAFARRAEPGRPFF